MKNLIVKNGLWALGLLLMLGVSVAAYGFSRANENETAADIFEVPCTSSGEQVSKDPCPLVQGNQACCSGEVDSSQSGESCCGEKCELGADGETAKAEQEVPACCSEK